MDTKRYFIELSYNGAAYCGWQSQPNAPTVQQTLQDALSRLLKAPIIVVGCGRTDTGVHSSYYVAHMDCAEFDFTPDFLYHLNCLLPKDISVSTIVPSMLHARFDATYREYQYFISRVKNPFKDKQVWPLVIPLDTEAMAAATARLMDYTDFTSFARTGSDNKTNLCTIFCAQWNFSAEQYVFTIASDRFLRGMVRTIVGTLVDVGRGKISIDGFARIIEQRNRAKASSAAPPDGLFLTEVRY
ncbi:MAG: tRNA pseudouridine(38-40) synthase TruA [Mucinivorans sp.]